MAIPIGITKSIGKARIIGKVVKITTIAAILLKIAGAKSINKSFSNLIVPSRQRFKRPCIFPVIFSLKYSNGAFNKDEITIPLAFCSVLVAVSSTIILRSMIISSLPTLTIKIRSRIGIT